MPIRPENRKFYGREWREQIRPRVIERAGGQCQSCGCYAGEIVLNRFGLPWAVVLSVGHIDNDPPNMADTNLRCWCSRCHLRFDLAFHKQTRCRRKDLARPLLVA